MVFMARSFRVSLCYFFFLQTDQRAGCALSELLHNHATPVFVASPYLHVLALTSSRPLTDFHTAI